MFGRTVQFIYADVPVTTNSTEFRDLMSNVWKHIAKYLKSGGSFFIQVLKFEILVYIFTNCLLKKVAHSSLAFEVQSLMFDEGIKKFLDSNGIQLSLDDEITVIAYTDSNER